MHLKYVIFTMCSLLAIHSVLSQESESLTRAYLEQNGATHHLTNEDIQDWIITNENQSKQSKIKHIYGIQRHNGIEINGATFGLHLINNDEVVKFTTNFISGLSQKTEFTKTSPTISAVKAVQFAIDQLRLSNTKPITIIEQAAGVDFKQLIDAPGVSTDQVPAKLMYFKKDDGALVLVWDISISELNGTNWWSLKIDAATGTILDKVNLVVSCSFEEINKVADPLTTINTISGSNATSTLIGGYNVYPYPIESPNQGGRSVVIDPDNSIASPFGWHDTNGSSGAEYTITRGNNVYAYDDDDANNQPGFSPNGGSTLTFNFPINTTYSNANQSEAAAITNLFYWNNLIHDIWYQYGFDEASGNFQENNYGKGGAGSDSVNAEAQDGSGTCNANFATPPDGSNPRMQMYVCGARDGDIDNGVIVHEYGHGISIRLVGGANNVTSLRNQEQMGEGWSDWFALMMTIESGDQGSDLRPIGNWLLGQGANGAGIRTYPYSTDIATSQYTYDDIKTFSVPHGVGSVWASMLWELTWELINEYGYDSDFYKGTGGNNIAMQLVIEGLKLTPSSPGFVDGRDAILQADQALYQGANSCFIWKAFAKRGLGVSASQGSSSSRSDGTEAFDIPDCDNCEENLTITTPVNSGQTDTKEASNSITATNIINNGGTARYNAGNKIVLKTGFMAKSGAYFKAFIEDCSDDLSVVEQPIHQKITIAYEEQATEKNIVVNKNVFEAYPNPTENLLTIKSKEDMEHWELKNYMGTTVGISKMKNNTFQEGILTLGFLPSGLYILEVTFSTGEVLYKNIIKK